MLPNCSFCNTNLILLCQNLSMATRHPPGHHDLAVFLAVLSPFPTLHRPLDVVERTWVLKPERCRFGFLTPLLQSDLGEFNLSDCYSLLYNLRIIVNTFVAVLFGLSVTTLFGLNNIA